MPKAVIVQISGVITAFLEINTIYIHKKFILRYRDTQKGTITLKKMKLFSLFLHNFQNNSGKFKILISLSRINGNFSVFM